MSESRLLVLAAVACCGAPTARKPWVDPAPIVEDLAPRVVLEVDRPAENYGDAPFFAGVRLAAADNFYVQLVQLRPGLQRDARLDAVASDLSGLVRGDADITDGAAAFSLRSRGLIEPAARVAVVEAGFDPHSLEADLAPDNVRIGIGGSPLIVVVVHSMLATLAPVPRRVELHGSARILGSVDARFHAPRFTVTTFGRPSQSLDGDPRPGVGFDVRVNCGDIPETRWVNLEARDVDNELTPLALFAISCGDPLPTKYYVEPRANLGGGDIERRIMALLNRQRVANGLAPLHPDPRLLRAAHSYARLMKDARSVAHDLGHTTPTGRLRDVDVVPPVTIESTLQARGLGAVAEVLWNDPAYRVTYAKPEATHAGVGIAEDAEHELYVDIEIERIVPVADLKKVRARLQTRIREYSDRPTHVDSTLQRFADRAAAELAAGGDQEELSKHLGRELLQSLPKETVLDSTQVILRDVDDWNDDLLKTMVPFDSIGVGVAQTARDGRDAGQLWVVVFFAVRVEPHN